MYVQKFKFNIAQKFLNEINKLYICITADYFYGILCDQKSELTFVEKRQKSTFSTVQSIIQSRIRINKRQNNKNLLS